MLGVEERDLERLAPLRPSATPNSTRCPDRGAVVPGGRDEECTKTFTTVVARDARASLPDGKPGNSRGVPNGFPRHGNEARIRLTRASCGVGGPYRWVRSVGRDSAVKRAASTGVAPGLEAGSPVTDTTVAK